MPRSDTARPCGTSMFNCLRNQLIDWQSDWTSLYSHHQCIEVALLTTSFPEFLACIPNDHIPDCGKMESSIDFNVSCDHGYWVYIKVFPHGLLFTFWVFSIEFLIRSIFKSYLCIFLMCSLFVFSRHQSSSTLWAVYPLTSELPLLCEAFWIHEIPFVDYWSYSLSFQGLIQKALTYAY